MKEKRYLIAVDLQNDFIDGSLGTPEAQQIVQKAAEKIIARRDAGDTVIATMDTHESDYMNTREGRFLPVPHCIRGTKGWELNPDIQKALGDSVIVEKPTFGSVDLVKMIEHSIEPDEKLTFELIGLCTDICVVSNALLLKAAFPEADFIVDSACCAGVTKEKHLAALETMRSCQIEVH